MGRPRGGSNEYYKNFRDPSCLGETLRRVILTNFYKFPENAKLRFRRQHGVHNAGLEHCPDTDRNTGER